MRNFQAIEFADPASAQALLEWKWFTDGVDLYESEALASIADAAGKQPSLAKRMLEMPWLDDGITPHEGELLNALRTLYFYYESSMGTEIAQTLLNLPWLADDFTSEESEVTKNIARLVYDGYPGAAQRMLALEWVADGISPGEGDAFMETVAAFQHSPDLLELLADLPWVADSLDPDYWGLEMRVIRSIGLTVLLEAPLAEYLLQASWVADGLTEDDFRVLQNLSGYVFDGVGGHGLERLFELAWVADGITRQEVFALRVLGDLVVEHPSLAVDVLELPWVNEGLRPGTRLIENLSELAREDLQLAQAMVNMPWIRDGIESYEWGAVGFAKALRVIGHERSDDIWSHIYDDRDTTKMAAWSLNHIFLHDQMHGERKLELVLDKSWLLDGLNEEEAALVAVLNDFVDKEYVIRQLIDNDVVTTRTVALPSGADLDVILISRAGLQNEEYVLDTAAFGVETIETLMDVPWPQPRLVLVVEPEWRFTNPGETSPIRVLLKDFATEVLFHELSHHYMVGFTQWVTEGAAEFIESYVLSLYPPARYKKLAESRQDVQSGIDRCAGNGAPNIAVWEQTYQSNSSIRVCHYILGHAFFLDAYDLLGHDVVVDALQDIYARQQAHGRLVITDEVYEVFLSNTPERIQGELKNLFLRYYGELPTEG